jgi:hypothetical protein
LAKLRIKSGRSSGKLLDRLILAPLSMLGAAR